MPSDTDRLSGESQGGRSGLEALSVLEVQQLQRDLQLVEEGTRVIFALDAFEVIRFCFPAGMVGQVTDSFSDARSVAEHQAAMFEVFYGRSTPPFVLPEYTRELRSVLAFATHARESPTSDIERLRALLSSSEWRVEDSLPKDFADLDQIERSFSRTLAYVLGLYRIGQERLSEITENKLLKEFSDEVFGADAAELRRLFESYEPGTLALDIAEALASLAARRGVTEHDEHGRRVLRGIRTDASAVERLICLNEALDVAWKSRLLQSRYIVLYISSAAKTREIFALPQVQSRLPRSADRSRYPLWRSGRQLFAYAALRTDIEDPKIRARDTRERLSQLAESLRELDKLHKLVRGVSGGKGCDCVRTAGKGVDCPLRDNCSRTVRIESELRKRLEWSGNLSLLASVRRYHDLLGRVRDASHATMLRQFREVLNSADVAGRARERFKRIQQVLVAQAVTSRSLLESEAGVSPRAAEEKDRDPIVGCAHRFPIGVNMVEEVYHSFLEAVVAYVLLPPSQREEAALQLRELEHAFHELESEALQKDSVSAPEHELSRCLLWLIACSPETDERALSHARALEITMAELSVEFLCVAVWAARRCLQIPLSHALASRGLETRPNDPRLHHGLALSEYSLAITTVGSSEFPRQRLMACVASCEAALSHGEEWDLATRRVLRASVVNTAAYVELLLAEHDGERPTKARSRLTQLKQIVAKDEWKVRYPEYLHTEAAIELCESRHLIGAERSRKLRHALRDIQAARQADPEREGYAALVGRIQAELT